MTLLLRAGMNINKRGRWGDGENGRQGDRENRWMSEILLQGDPLPEGDRGGL